MKIRFLLSVVCLAGACMFAQNSSHPAGQAFSKMVEDARSRVKEINVDQFKQLKDSGEDFTLIDVREDGEWRAGHATGAVHMSKGVIERDIETKVPRKDAKLVLYCGGGSRSALAADSLMKMGYTNVTSLAGGLGAYKAAGQPVEK